MARAGRMPIISLDELEKESAKSVGVGKEEQTVKNTKDDSFDEKACRSLFGNGYTIQDLKGMNRLLEELRNNYPIERSAMHKEALITYIKYAYKRDKAIAEDDADLAEKWGKLAAKQAMDAKINPSQLSAADLSDGMSSFSQLSAMVEKAKDIIPLLPEYIKKPKDAVDFTLWEYINYARHLEGKPLVPYKELYKFIISRVEAFHKDNPEIEIPIQDYYDFDNDDTYGEK